jgi:hypothetical protein
VAPSLARLLPGPHLVIDERLDRWTDRLHWVEGKVGAARDAAQLVATLPPEQIRPQVLRIGARLQLDPTGITAEVADAISRDADAPGRPGRWDRRHDLDRGQAVTAPGGAAQLARAGYPARLVAASAALPGPDTAAGDTTGAGMIPYRAGGLAR